MSYTLVARLTFGKYGDVMSNNPRSVTRTLFASPIFWAMLGAYLAGRVTPLDAPDWVGPASGLACAILAGLIERWYVYPRTPVGVVDKSLRVARKRFIDARRHS